MSTVNELQYRIYCIILFPSLGKAVALNRDYSFLSDDKAVWGPVKVEDIIESDNQFFAGQAIPEWACEADLHNRGHIAMWTNYYEGGVGCSCHRYYGEIMRHRPDCRFGRR